MKASNAPFVVVRSLAISANRWVTTSVLCEAAQVIHSVYKELDTSSDEQGIIDLLTVTTCSHSSLYGVGCMVEVIVGLVVLCHVALLSELLLR